MSSIQSAKDQKAPDTTATAETISLDQMLAQLDDVMWLTYKAWPVGWRKALASKLRHWSVELHEDGVIAEFERAP